MEINVEDINEKPAEAKTQAPLVAINDSGIFSFNNHLELKNAASMAITLNFVPKRLLESGGVQAAAAALMFLKQFSLPFKAMNELGWIKGNLTVYGSLYWALAERHPDFGEYEMFWLDENQEKICSDNKNLKSPAWAAVLQVRKKNSQIWNEYFFTLDDAVKAGLYSPNSAGSTPWYKYTKDMLMHKAKKRAIDANYSSALNGCMYHEDIYEALEKDVSVNKEAHKTLANTFEEQ